MRPMLPVIVGTVVCASSLWAHHSPAGFDLGSVVVLQGTVNRVD